MLSSWPLTVWLLLRTLEASGKLTTIENWRSHQVIRLFFALRTGLFQFQTSSIYVSVRLWLWHLNQIIRHNVFFGLSHCNTKMCFVADPEAILAEDSRRQACRQFFQTGKHDHCQGYCILIFLCYCRNKSLTVRNVRGVYSELLGPVTPTRG